jgi:site-specific DNA recombinase
MRVVVYCRVSTADQADHGVSLEAQQAKLKAYADLYDLTVIETINDAGESAKSLNRPGLQQALAMLRKGEADGLLVAKLDRLTRSVADWQTLIDGYFGEKAGKQLFSLSDSIDTRTAAGRMVLNMLLVVSQWEREIIGERTREALRHKIRKGQRVGRVLYGYDLAVDGKTLVVNESEQRTIGLIKELRSAGRSLEQIATELSQRGIPTKAGLNNWVHTAVRRILNRQETTAA